MRNPKDSVSTSTSFTIAQFEVPVAQIVTDVKGLSTASNGPAVTDIGKAFGPVLATASLSSPLKWISILFCCFRHFASSRRDIGVDRSRVASETGAGGNSSDR
jgi:hypothetical protein